MDNIDETLYSFTNADQGRRMLFGMDTTTEEGRELYRQEYEALSTIAPEILKKEDMVYPHELPKPINQEAHFQRLWRIYQSHTLKSEAKAAVAAGKVSQEDLEAAGRFLGAKGTRLSVTEYIYTKYGARPDLAEDEGFLATDRVMTAIGMNQVEYTKLTAQDPEGQFWRQVNNVFTLSEAGLKQELAIMITDPANKMKVDAIMDGKAGYLEEETTKQLGQ